LANVAYARDSGAAVGARAVAERSEEPEAEVEAGAPDLSAAAALAVGLRRSRSKGNADQDAKLDSFLDEQTGLVRLQKEHLHEQREVQLSHLKLRRFNEWMKAALQVLTACVGLTLVCVVATMAWQAHEDRGVSIEAFSVPPDLAQRGLTGQVVASELLDRLSELQAQTVTARPTSTYADDWGDDIKVAIPETGVSIGELNRWLRQWLGGETRITGEVVRTPAGLAVTARAGASSGKRFEGAEADLDKLVGQAAEALYAQTQPYRYAVYLASRGRSDDALAAYQRLARTGAAEDRPWAYVGWASILQQGGRNREAEWAAQSAVRLDPKLEPAYAVLSAAQFNLGWTEAALSSLRREIALLERGRSVGQPTSDAAGRLALIRGIEAFVRGDYQASASLLRSAGGMNYEGQAQGYPPSQVLVQVLAFDHDVAASRRIATTPLQMIALEDWTSLARGTDAFRGTEQFRKAQTEATTVASVATVYAHAGRFDDADAVLRPSALDCYPCLRTRGLIAALKRDWPAADRWYAEAARQAPSLAFAHADWGQALLDKGDLDGAIAKFKEAHRRSPHFADPLELWGEALMRKGDYDGAIAKFAEADKYAPRWGRNHLRWGEALLRVGRYREARAQFEQARGMDLSVPDHAALKVFLDRTAWGPLHG
jgi:tetratricopeptide (TPR) repeat protein